MNESRPKLFSFRRCPYAIRARMALILKQIPFEIHEVDLKHKPPELLALSPKGTVPVLCLPSGVVIDESIDIVEFALDYQPDPQTEQLIQQLTDDYIPAVTRYKFADRHPDIDILYEQQRILSFLEKLELLLQKKPYLYGKVMGKADICILPFIRYLYRADEAWFNSLDLPKLKAWFFDFINSDLHQRVMMKIT